MVHNDSSSGFRDAPFLVLHCRPKSTFVLGITVRSSSVHTSRQSCAVKKTDPILNEKSKKASGTHDMLVPSPAKHCSTVSAAMRIAHSTSGAATHADAALQIELADKMMQSMAP